MSLQHFQKDTDGPKKGAKVTGQKTRTFAVFHLYLGFPRVGYHAWKRQHVYCRHAALIECTIGFLHQIVCCVFKVDAEMPSVPWRPGTSSLPT